MKSLSDTFVREATSRGVLLGRTHSAEMMGSDDHCFAYLYKGRIILLQYICGMYEGGSEIDVEELRRNVGNNAVAAYHQHTSTQP